MNVEVTTLADALKSGEITPEQANVRIYRGVVHFPCPGCGHLKHPDALVDFRGVDEVEGDFRCDGCWSDLERKIWANFG